MEYVTKHCLLCDSNEQVQDLYPQTFGDEDLTPAVFSARRTTEHFHYRMVKCNCGLVFSREILPESKLFELYSESAFTFAEHTQSLRRDYWTPLAPWLKGRPQRSALEAGCSNGFFLDELQERGFTEVMGFEPSREAKAMASPKVRPFIRNEYFLGEQSVPGSQFDLVCSFHTLDHMTDPLKFLKDCRQVIAPQGLVYIVVHNVKALQAKVLGEKSPIIDIEHIYLFNEETLSRALERAGFRVLTAGPLKNSYPLDYWLRMLPLPEKPKHWARSAVRTAGLSSFSPVISAGNLLAIATPG
jgi:SAM-dependent methyltransferase